MSFWSDIQAFHKKFGWRQQKKPAIPKVRSDLISFRVKFLEEELDELKEAIENRDIVEVFDAILDIAYVGLGNGAMVFGLKDKIEDGYAEVQASNMSKICSTEEEAIKTVEVRSREQNTKCHYEKTKYGYVVYRSHDNKVMKNINYFRPNLRQFFTRSEILFTVSRFVCNHF